MQSLDPRDVRFDRAQLARVEECALHAVRSGACLQRAEARAFVLGRGDDGLAAALVGEVVVGTEGLEERAPAQAETSLQAVRHVIEPAVNDARVPACLVEAHGGLLVEHGHRRRASASEGLTGDGETHDSAADHGERPTEAQEECFTTHQGVARDRGVRRGPFRPAYSEIPGGPKWL